MIEGIKINERIERQLTHKEDYDSKGSQKSKKIKVLRKLRNGRVFLRKDP